MARPAYYQVDGAEWQWQGEIGSEEAKTLTKAPNPQKKVLQSFLIFTDGRSKNHSNGQGRGRQVLFNTAVCQWDVCGCLVQRNH
jgi:hypothetical protein